ncbi:unnamed protein product [Haemonchus placei]|uniref:Secreted protein n=1 Tax=Haemonchus placei TaxID=6290 RepID=A0A0N4WNF7_HAEPC|nr:unnamed protein product [Haemonchus placei]
MGQRLAPCLAIAFMAKLETPIFERLPMMCCRSSTTASWSARHERKCLMSDFRLTSAY